MGKRKKKEATADSENLVETIVSAMDDKKAENVVIMDLSAIEMRIADHYVICSANSGMQVEAIAEHVERLILKEHGQKPIHRDGFDNAEWVLLDYFDIIIHIFRTEFRDFYNLEKLWADAQIKRL